MPYSHQNCFRSLGMISQMNLIMIPLVVIIITIFIVAQAINIKMTGYEFEQASNVLLSSNNNKDLSIRLERLVRITKNLLNIDGHKAQSVNLLYNKSFENSGSNQSYEELGLELRQSSKYKMLLYHVYGDPVGNDYYNLQFINFTSVLNTVIFALDLTKTFTNNNLIVILNSSAGLFASSLSLPAQAQYNPLLRPFYLEQVEYYQKFQANLYLTQIYQKAGTPYYTLSVQNSLIKDGFRGLVTLSIDFTLMLNSLSVTQDNVILIYENGTILFQNAYTNYVLLEQTATVDNSSLTGFNIDQWNSFKEASLQTPFRNILITYNSVFKQDMRINIHKFPTLPLYLLMYLQRIFRFTNLQENKNAENISQQIVDSLQTEQIRYMIIIIVSDICLFIILSFLMVLTISPIKRIQWHVRNSSKITQSNTMFLAKESNNNQLLNLEFDLIQLIVRMKQSPMNKSDLCKNIEKFQWIKRDLQPDILLDDIPDGCQIIEKKRNVFKLMTIYQQISN